MAHRSLLRSSLSLLLALALSGCGGSSEPPGDAPAKPHGRSATSGGRHASKTGGDKKERAKGPPRSAAKRPKPPKNRSLADLLSGDPEAMNVPQEILDDPPDGFGRFVSELPRMKIDEAKVRAQGIRRLQGKHLVLYTDLPAGPEIDSLPEVFDLAFPQWCDYFGVKPSEHADWRLTGVLMKDKTRFQKCGLLPADLPPFPHGFSRNFEFWLYEQPSDYYRRHLLLHEGTHGFMNTILGSCGPPWYMEGIAELLATHRWRDGKLRMNYFPATREEVPMWGRIKIVRDAYAGFRGKRLREILAYGGSAHRENEPYGWCWAAVAFLDGHPAYRDRFRKLPRFVGKPDFNERFIQLFRDQWDEVAEQWEVFVGSLQYGHDLTRTAVDFAPGKPLPPGGTTVTVAADRGWQNTGIRLEAGVRYRLTASGRYQVDDEPRIWWCSPGGVSIRYWNGLPLGVLLAAVHPDHYNYDQPSPLSRPLRVGLGGRLTPGESGTLLLRINDSPAELDDNAGTLTVRVEPDQPSGAAENPSHATGSPQ